MNDDETDRIADVGENDVLTEMQDDCHRRGTPKRVDQLLGRTISTISAIRGCIIVVVVVMIRMT